MLFDPFDVLINFEDDFLVNLSNLSYFSHDLFMKLVFGIKCKGEFYYSFTSEILNDFL
jgi:hypothetical protein